MESRKIRFAIGNIVYKRFFRYIIVTTLILECFESIAQKAVYPDSLLVDFDFFEGKIDDTNHLRLTLTYRNAGKSIAFVDSVLIDGIRPDHFYSGNLDFELQRFEDGKYTGYVNRYIHYIWDPAIVGKIKRPFTVLKPSELTTRTYNAFDMGIGAIPGKYKMRVTLLKLPIIPTFLFEKEFYRSRWFSFEIMRSMQLIHNDDGSIRFNSINK